jgi:hypothetical protein
MIILLVNGTIDMMNQDILKDWDGSLKTYVETMTEMCSKAKGFGLETMVLIRDTDPIGQSTSYRCIRCCDYIVAIGLLSVAMDDMMAGEVEDEPDN